MPKPSKRDQRVEATKELLREVGYEAMSPRDIQARSAAKRVFSLEGSGFQLFLVNFLNFFDPSFGTLVGACAKCPAPYGARQLVLRRREESPRSQTPRYPGKVPRLQRRTHLPFDPLDGAPPTLDALLAGASAS